MKKLVKIIAFSCILFFAACNNNQQKNNADTLNVQNATTVNTLEDREPKTTISFKDTLIDFGNKNQGEILHFTYNFKNTGNNPLIIKDVRPSCGCTIAKYPKEAIAPGGEGEIVAEFDTNKGGIGNVQKLITVVSNDAQRSERYLLFQGNISEAKF